MRRILALTVAAVAMVAVPASAGPRVCTPSYEGTTVGGCVDVVCLKLCVNQVDVDPQCHIDRPAPLVVHSVCSAVDRQYVQIGG
jgi:hypothetical protein